MFISYPHLHCLKSLSLWHVCILIYKSVKKQKCINCFLLVWTQRCKDLLKPELTQTHSHVCSWQAFCKLTKYTAGKHYSAQGDSERLQTEHRFFLMMKFGQSFVTQSSSPSLPQKGMRIFSTEMPHFSSCPLGWLPGLILAVSCQCELAWWLWDLIRGVDFHLDFHLPYCLLIWDHLGSSVCPVCIALVGSPWLPAHLLWGSSPVPAGPWQAESFPAPVEICHIYEGLLSSLPRAMEQRGEA